MTTGAIFATFSDYQGFIAACRARAAELKIALGSENAADITSLPVGYLAKLLAPHRGKTPAQLRQVGLISLGPVLGLLGVRLAMIEDPTALRRFSARIKPRNEAYVRHTRGDTVHVEVDLATLRKNGADGGRKSRMSMSIAKSRKLARKAAHARYAGGKSAKRSEQARHAALCRWARTRDADPT